MTIAIRAAWLLLAVIPNALSTHDSTAVATWILWLAWATVALAVLLPHPLSLTVCRFVGPLVVVHIAWRLANLGSEAPWGLYVGVVIAAAATAAMFASAYGATHAQAAAYGHERRYLLRPPVSVLLPIAMLWALVGVAGSVAVLTKSAAISVIATTVLVLLLAFSLRRGVVLARRWLVFVPAGIAVHDPLVLRDTFMARSHDVRSLQPISDDSEAFDATCTTWGAPLEIVLSHPHDVSLSQFGSRISQTLDRLHVTSLLVAPSRPDDALGNRV